MLTAEQRAARARTAAKASAIVRRARADRLTLDTAVGIILTRAPQLTMNQLADLRIMLDMASREVTGK